jgi:hypothetical protein
LILALTFVAGGAAPVAAQSVNELDLDRARIGATLLYGGHGPDVEIFTDSQALRTRVRFRAAVGLGRWADQSGGGDGNQGPGAPQVMRMAFTVLGFGRSECYVTKPHVASVLCKDTTPPRKIAPRAYGGAGVATYLPRSESVRGQGGVRVVLGMEGRTKAFEVQCDLPMSHAPQVRSVARNGLDPQCRIGFGVRRVF